MSSTSTGNVELDGLLAKVEGWMSRAEAAYVAADPGLDARLLGRYRMGLRAFLGRSSIAPKSPLSEVFRREVGGDPARPMPPGVAPVVRAFAAIQRAVKVLEDAGVDDNEGGDLADVADRLQTEAVELEAEVGRLLAE